MLLLFMQKNGVYIFVHCYAETVIFVALQLIMIATFYTFFIIVNEGEEHYGCDSVLPTIPKGEIIGLQVIIIVNTGIVSAIGHCYQHRNCKSD